MDNSSVLHEISYWKNELPKHDERIIEVAFFKIFVKFEVFLSKIFICYSIGNSSSKGFTADRKLEFIDEKHFQGMLKHSRNNYIDYVSRIDILSNHIFVDEKDPFSLIFRDARFNTLYQKMKYLRNFIAHESDESRHLYQKHVIGLTNPYLEPKDYLLKINKAYSKSNFTIFIEIIEEISEVLLNPEPYFKQVM